ncbi:MarR family EPS-associated transcriptional regulator [Desulfobulbus alkaliphilus]|uniref:MarR family EPS-associated transcriptional regulator n=1 Tax=Desulfobulbus alkaliphilus TaxID=869814 RepID=UPI001965AF7E|nr:MarR family EPS-associated transcriptional regulator [Desulfobulbus alkaliphilus]MBM9538601.1 MarR family EPS-associated transcriptional regulator [Desulfobulbus alkaliphilus]
MTDETRYQLLRRLATNPDTNQRQLAAELGISLGKLNYCLQALISKGWVKAGNFSRSSNKKGYAYLLTPSGIEAKARLTIAFLHRKMAEYEQLHQEIETLRQEVHALQQKPAEGPQ